MPGGALGIVMIESADDIIDTPARSADAVDQLRSTAERLAGGLNLLRWAMIICLAGELIGFAGNWLLDMTMSPGRSGWVWGRFAFSVTGWAVWPLALMGMLRILRARDWSLPRWLVIAIVFYFAAACAWAPIRPVWVLVASIGIGDGVLSFIRPWVTAAGLILSLVCFAVLFAGYHLARAVDEHFNRSLISDRRRRWLLWSGFVLHSLGLLWWVAWLVWGAARSLYVASDHQYDLYLVLVTAQWLTAGLPFYAWLVWLLIEAVRIGRKLKRFVKLNRCPNCGYDLRERITEGCPECGWGRGPARGVP